MYEEEDVNIEIANPFKGLRAFNEADSENFFGRETLIQQLLARLSEGGDLSRFLAVIGPSGSGKSSVVRAGFDSRFKARRFTWIGKLVRGGYASWQTSV